MLAFWNKGIGFAERLAVFLLGGPSDNKYICDEVTHGFQEEIDGLVSATTCSLRCSKASNCAAWSWQTDPAKGKGQAICRLIPKVTKTSAGSKLTTISGYPKQGISRSRCCIWLELTGFHCIFLNMEIPACVYRRYCVPFLALTSCLSAVIPLPAVEERCSTEVSYGMAYIGTQVCLP
jgi:hypothetical protein